MGATGAEVVTVGALPLEGFVALPLEGFVPLEPLEGFVPLEPLEGFVPFSHSWTRRRACPSFAMAEWQLVATSTKKGIKRVRFMIDYFDSSC